MSAMAAMAPITIPAIAPPPNPLFVDGETGDVVEVVVEEEAGELVGEDGVGRDSEPPSLVVTLSRTETL